MPFPKQQSIKRVRFFFFNSAEEGMGEGETGYPYQLLGEWKAGVFGVVFISLGEFCCRPEGQVTSAWEVFSSSSAVGPLCIQSHIT